MKWHTHDLTLSQFWHPPTPPAVYCGHQLVCVAVYLKGA